MALFDGVLDFFGIRQQVSDFPRGTIVTFDPDEKVYAVVISQVEYEDAIRKNPKLYPSDQRPINRRKEVYLRTENGYCLILPKQALKRAEPRTELEKILQKKDN